MASARINVAADDPAAAPRRHTRWFMLTIAFLAQNLVPGLVFGSFGALILASQSHLGTSRGAASLGLGLVLLANGLCSPTVAWLVARTSLRSTMIAGAMLSGLGYVALGFANNVSAVLAASLLLLGPGVAYCGVLTANALVCNWFTQGQGRALGVCNMPLAVMLIPPACVALLESLGLRGVYLCLAALHVPLIGALLFVADRPDRAEDAPAPPRDAAIVEPARLLASKTFWLLAIVSSLVVAGAISKSAHLAPLMVERGMNLKRAAVLLSIAGGTGILGSPLFGWLAERRGGGVALATSAFVQGSAWFLLLTANSFAILVVDAAIVGACAGGYVVSMAVLISALYGPSRFAAIFGMVSPFTLPVVFLAAPMVGYLHDLTGSYTVPFVIHIAAFGMAGMASLALVGAERQHRTSLT